jgi:hypothetical protein
MDFDKWLQRFVTGIEKIIFRLALALVVLLFLVQALLTEEDSRLFLSKTDQFEGKPLTENIHDVISRRVIGEEKVTVPVEEPALLLKLIPPKGISPELFLLINNEIFAQFGETNIYVTVEAGDLLELVGEVPGNVPAVVQVVQVYGNLKTPQKGDEVKTFGERELLAWIIP